MSDAEAVRLAVAIVAGLVLGYLIGREVTRAPVGYQDERGYGPVDLRTLLRQAETRGYHRGRRAGIEACHPPRQRNGTAPRLRIVGDTEYDGDSAEAGGYRGGAAS